MNNPSDDALNEDIAAGVSSPAAVSTSNLTAGVKSPEKPMAHVSRRKKKGEEYQLAGQIDKAIKAAANRALNEVSRWNSQSRSWLGGGWDEGHPDANPHNAADIATQANRYAKANEPWRPPAGWKPAPTRRFYFDVPYEIKDYAKRQGLKWDPTVKKWYKEMKHVTNALPDVYGLQHIDDKGKIQGHPKKKVYVQVERGDEKQAAFQGFRKDTKGWWILMRDIWSGDTVSGYKVVK